MELALHRLRMLRELTRRGTVTEAAVALHYTASAVSQQLALLEKEVGAPLFERVGRRVRLTELGWLLASHAEDILSAEERARVALEEAQGAVAASLSVGVFATVAAGLLPILLRRLNAEHPGIRVVTREVAPEAALRAVRHGDLDLSFLLDYPTAPITPEPNLELVPVATEHLHLVLPASVNPLDPGIKLSAFADVDWIMAGPESHFGRAIRVACRNNGFEPRVVHVVDEQATAMAMVAAGLGVTLVSDLGLSFRPSGVEILDLEGTLSRNIVIAYRPTALRRPALQVLLDAVHAATATLPRPIAGADREPGPRRVAAEASETAG